MTSEGEASNAYNDPSQGISITQTSLFGPCEEKPRPLEPQNPADVIEKVLSSGIMKDTPARRSDSTEHIPPPPPEGGRDPREYINSAQVPRRDFADVHPITEEEIRQALKKEVAKHGSWKKGAAKKMQIEAIDCQTALHYTLESFTESRSVSSTTEPVSIGHFLDAANSFATGDPWDVSCEPSAAFVEETKQSELPGTSSLTVRKPGGTAYGMGTPVHFLNQTGVPPPGIGHHDLCYFCHGTGIKQCTNCKGQGKKQCTVCGGSGSVRTYTKIKIKFGVERSEFYYDEGGVPEKYLRAVTGEVILAENQNLEVNEQSKRLLTIQLNKCLGKCKILSQRQILEAVPIARVRYSLPGQEGTFWVYGQERLCYVPNYPAKCTIL